jgi:CRP-like cAMP-binding protein
MATKMLIGESQFQSFTRSTEIDYSAQAYQFRRGESLALQPQLLWKLEQGFVRTLTWDESGNVVTLGIWGANEFVGQPFSQLHPYQIECLTDVHAKKVASIEVAPPMSMLNHVYQTEKLLSIIHCKRTSIRLLLFLEWLAQRFGHKHDQGWRLELKLTHQVIAEIIGTTRVTVTRLLQQLERDGKLIRGRKSLIVTSVF